MQVINRNIRNLRERAGWTQKELATKLEVKPPVIGSYEEFRSTPSIFMAIKIADLFDIDVDTLVRKDLIKGKDFVHGRYQRGKDVIAITVDRLNNEYIEFVNQKASAGYLNGYMDAEYIKELPKISLPFLSPNKTYRAFEIKGESMLPIESGSIIIGEFIPNLENIKDGENHIVVTKENGISYKRVYNFITKSGDLLLISDNTSFAPYTIDANDVIQLWRQKRIIINSAGELNSDEVKMNLLTDFVLKLQATVRKKKIKF